LAKLEELLMSILSPARRRAAATILALVLAAPLALAAADKRLITETDLFKFVWVGRQAVFVRVTVDEKKTGYDTALWIVPTDGSQPARPFTSGPADNSPVWSPDGSRIAFVRPTDKKEAQIHLISTQGGEAVALTDIPGGAGDPVWSPDGKTIVFGARANAKDLEGWGKDKKDAKDAKAKKDEEEHESDVRVVTRAVYRFNGGGYADPTHQNHLWTVQVPAAGVTAMPRPKQLTSGEFDEGGAFWSNDGSTIYFASQRVKEGYYERPKGTIYAVPAKGGEPREALTFAGGAQEAELSPDGRLLAMAGNLDEGKDYSFNQSDFFTMPLAGGAKPRNLTANYDFDLLEGLAADQHAPRGGNPQPLVWAGDGRSVIAAVGERGRVNLKRIDVGSGAIQPVTSGDQEIVSYSGSRDGSRLAVVVSTPTVIGDLYALDAATGRMTPLYKPNQELFAQLDLTAPEEIAYKSFDGREIHAFVQKPPDYKAGRKYPLILNIHGGPHSAFGYTFFHEMQWMAAKGYVVIYPNPRGSSTYGQEFGNVIQYNFPGDDAKDLLAGVDEMVKRGLADPKRLGVTGGSGGGILTNWIVTQTDRFAAAVSQRSISDWASFWYTADFWLSRPTWFRAAPWEDPEDYARRSPITHVDKVTTPLMLIEGEDDYRTPPAAGGEQMFRALKYLKRPTVMVRFPGETHELSRSGQPWHRIERLRHITAWFDKYLQGKKIDTYDVPEVAAR
jgi:dipeptidyl aminopeptidase/acylaminoacyl peptidase